MLSLYDQRIQHKMLIFDDTSSNNQQENPQFSINNLLLHHHSSRVSINNKIKTINNKRNYSNHQHFQVHLIYQNLH